MADYGQFQSPADLASMYGEGSFEANLAARRNEDLASQFRQQALEQQQNATRKGSLENDQSQSMNPLLLEHQGLINTGRGYENTGKNIKNTSDQLNLEVQQANQPNVLSAQARKAALDATDDEMKAFDAEIGKNMRSRDPEVRRQAIQMQTWLPLMQAERRKAADEIAKINAQGANHLAGIKMQTGSAERINDANIAAGKFTRNSKAGFSIEQRIDMENDPSKKMALLIDAANQAKQSGDEETSNLYIQRAQALDNLVKMRSPNAIPRAGALDIGQAAQLPTNPSPSAMPQGAPPALAPQQGQAPQAAIDHLKAHPELAGAFQQKYGYLPK